MDQPCSNPVKATRPGCLTMLRSLLRLTCCTLLLLASLSSPGESRPRMSQEALLLEAVKTGILSSLGLDREPRPSEKASEEELREMYQLYRETLREMRGNSSQSVRESSQSTMSTVLFPASVELRNVRRKAEAAGPGQAVRWHRAVFHKNPNIQTELTLARAELKISRQVLDKPTSARPEAKPAIKVKVDRRRPANSWTRVASLLRTNTSSSQDVMMDISPEVQRWMRSDAGQPLVVDIGTLVDEKDAQSPTVSLELGLAWPGAARGTRPRRSDDKEDECDEHGWCCRRSVTVSFKDIGWSDWVVAPAEYTMNFCDGTCPHNYKPASMHTQVKSRLHQISKGGTPRPCCVPALYEPMVLMHYDSRGKLALTPFDDLIVSKCHCA